MQEGIIKGQFKIEHIEKTEDKKLAFGWAYMTNDSTGNTMVDHSGDIVDITEIEKAAYKFVKLWRDGSDNHERGGVAVLVESIVFTREKLAALGLEQNSLPYGWWVGFEIIDDEVWNKVKSGEYSMMSIEGSARRVPVED